MKEGLLGTPEPNMYAFEEFIQNKKTDTREFLERVLEEVTCYDEVLVRIGIKGEPGWWIPL